MSRVCSVCNHPQRAEIDRALVAGAANRRIAAQFGLTDPSVRRHKRDHIARFLANSGTIDAPPVSAQQTAQAGSQSIDVFTTLTRQIERLEMLSDAVDRWLRDPGDETRYSIDPRTSDIMVVYLDWNETDANGNPKRKKATLETLLEMANPNGMREPERVESKTADPRTLLGVVAEGLKGQMQLAIVVLEKLYNAQAIETFEAAVLDAVDEVAPDVRESIERSLRSRRPLRQALGTSIGRA